MRYKLSANPSESVKFFFSFIWLVGMVVMVMVVVTVVVMVAVVVMVVVMVAVMVFGTGLEVIGVVPGRWLGWLW